MFDWFRARALSTGLGVLVLFGAICGPVALYVAWTNDQPPREPQLDYPDGRAGVAGEFASLFVASWIRGDDLGFFSQRLNAEDSGLLVERVGAVRSVERGQGLYDVVVAADLVEFLAGSEEQFRPIGLRFYAVGVSIDGSNNMTVLGLPSVVTEPEQAQALPAVVNEMRRPEAPEVAALAQTLDGFFSAFLAGEGNVQLFTTPGATITAVSPAPFGQADVQELGWGGVPGVDDPTVRLARVLVDAYSPAGKQRLEYSIVVTERDGRWEVSQMLHSPVVIKPDVTS